MKTAEFLDQCSNSSSMFDITEVAMNAEAVNDNLTLALAAQKLRYAAEDFQSELNEIGFVWG